MTRRDKQAQERYFSTTVGKMEKDFHNYVLRNVKKNDGNENKEKKGEDKESYSEPVDCRC